MKVVYRDGSGRGHLRRWGRAGFLYSVPGGLAMGPERFEVFSDWRRGAYIHCSPALDPCDDRKIRDDDGTLMVRLSAWFDHVDKYDRTLSNHFDFNPKKLLDSFEGCKEAAFFWNDVVAGDRGGERVSATLLWRRTMDGLGDFAKAHAHAYAVAAARIRLEREAGYISAQRYAWKLARKQFPCFVRRPPPLFYKWQYYAVKRAREHAENVRLTTWRGLIYDVIESARRERRRARLVLRDSARGLQYILQARFVGGKAWVDLGVVEWKENSNTGARERFRGFKSEVFAALHDHKLRARRAG